MVFVDDIFIFAHSPAVDWFADSARWALSARPYPVGSPRDPRLDDRMQFGIQL